MLLASLHMEQAVHRLAAMLLRWASPALSTVLMHAYIYIPSDPIRQAGLFGDETESGPADTFCYRCDSR
jgi:hypothetical protein